MTTDMSRWADRAMFPAEPHDNFVDGQGVVPSVKLLWMTPDPLGAVAAMCAMYEGRVVRNLNDITDDERAKALADVQATHLKAPLEAIEMQFLIEGVDRAFTHQLVRQRTAVYAQESMRFAVVGDLPRATTLPPSLVGKKNDHPQKVIWDGVLSHIDQAYHMLVENGMPAEEARGLLPHCVATRIIFKTDLRNLIDHAGNRLCTQAQFHWRMVFSQMVSEIANYGDRGIDEGCDWQFEAIATSNMFRPVCYQLGRCPFKASFDRACSIRERVDVGDFNRINPAEWLLDPTSARDRPETTKGGYD